MWVQDGDGTDGIWRRRFDRNGDFKLYGGLIAESRRDELGLGASDGYRRMEESISGISQQFIYPGSQATTDKA